MKIRKSFAAPILVAVFLVSNIANAALVSRLSGLAYYDTVADLTWLADANAVNGTIHWAEANTWAAGLSVAGVTGWRLPDIVQPDASCDNQVDPGGGFGLQGVSSNCTGSEMGDLYYNALGNTAGSISNLGPFSNIQNGFYWSAPEYAPNTDAAWSFRMASGTQGFGGKTNNFYAWAVQSGDVSAVPVPAAVWLFGSGLIGLIGFARRKKA